MSDLTGSTIAGRYRLDEFRGRGGMADVYKVWDGERAAFLAMKVLHEDLAEDQVFLRRFRREAQTLGKLKHPNIVRFYEIGQDGEIVFMLMEYVDGVTLSKARNRWGSTPTPPQILSLVQPVCSALHYAHQQDLIHCDIKPGNIMIERAGRVLLADFGIARVSEGATTATMVGAGTPAYMSPEQILGEDPSPQTDIYSLGVVLYELLTGGERPFTGEQATITGTVGEKIRWEKRNLDPPSPRTYNPSLSPALEEVVLRCLAKERKQRYSSVDELMDHLARAVGAAPEPLPTFIASREDKRLQQAVEPSPPPLSMPISQPSPTPPTPAPVATAAPARRGFWIAGSLFVGLGLGALLLAVGGLVYLRSSGGPFLGIPNTGASPAAAQIADRPTQEATATEPLPPSPTMEPTLPPPTVTSIPSRTPVPPPTQIPDVTLRQEHDSSGYYLIVQGGPDDYDIRYGPISDGSFILADNQKFAAYVDINGVVYIMNFRTDAPRPIHEFRKTDLQALEANSTPNYSLSFQVDNTGSYKLVVHESDYGDTLYVNIPTYLTE